MFRLIDKTIDIIFFSINWKNYFDRSILVISMTVLGHTPSYSPREDAGCQPKDPLGLTKYTNIKNSEIWLNSDVQVLWVSIPILRLHSSKQQGSKDF